MTSLAPKVLIHGKTENAIRIRKGNSKSPLKSSSNSNEKIKSGSQIRSRNEYSSTILSEKFSEEQPEITQMAQEIFEAKSKDLQIYPQAELEKRFVQQFSSNYFSRKLALQETKLGDETSLVLSKLLLTHKAFAHINLSKNKIGDANLSRIIRSLMSNLNLVSLDLSSTELSPSGCSIILSLLSSHRSLYSLDLSSHQFLYRNKIGSSDSLTYLLKSETLAFLNLSGTALGNEGLKHLLLGLENNKVLQYLNLGFNYIKGGVVKDFVQVLVTTSVGELILTGNQIEEVASEEIAYFLAGHYGYGVITKLSLASNLITYSSAYKLFDSMIKENYLLSLSLENNNLSGYLDIIERFLLYNNRLKTLNLSNCFLKTETFVQLCAGLSKNQSLEYLILSHNYCRDTGAAAMSKVLKKNKFLLKLDLANNKISSSGGVALANSLKSNNSLRYLNLSDNELKDEVGEAFLYIFGSNYTLSALLLHLNPMSAKYPLDIKKYLERNKVLEEKKQMSKIMENKTKKPKVPLSASEIEERVQKNLKEKKILEKKIGAYMKKITGIKKGVDEKLDEMQETVKELKGKNVELSKTLNDYLFEFKVFCI